MEKELTVGMDVSKGYADCIILDAHKNILEEAFRLEDTLSGYQQLLEVFQSWLNQGYQRINCGLESTGGYENNWVRMLLYSADQLPVRVARLNPSGVKELKKAALIRTEDDAVSAYFIGQYVLDYPSKVIWLSGQAIDNDFAAARKYNRSIAMIEKQKQQCLNQLEKLLYTYFSPWLVYMRNGVPDWMLKILMKYPAPEKVVKAGKKRLAKFVSLEKAQALLEKLKGHQGRAGMLDQVNIQETVQRILADKQLIASKHKLLAQQYKDDDQVKLLESICGIGLQTAVLLRVEIEEIYRFGSAKKLATYFGVSPKYIASGDKKGQTHMSKQGRPEVRKALYMSGLSAIRHDERIRKLYHRYRSKAHNHYQAMGVVMHKLLRIVYGILVSGKAYDPKIDQANQQRAEQKRKEGTEVEKQATQIKRKRLNRYQEESLTAPRSRRSAQKIKKQMASQSSTVEECTGSPNASS